MGKHKLDKKKEPPAPRPKFVMAPPNDDAAAYGWALGKLRYPDPNADPKEKDPWPGPYVFAVPTDLETRQVYGHNLDFVSTGYLQLLFDSSPEIRAAAEKVRDAGYSKEAMTQFSATVRKVFRDKVISDMTKRFEEVAHLVAEFYAARIAHIEKFGAED
jgi:hypothetical protein